MSVEALGLFDRSELLGDANGRGKSVRVFRRGKPLLFGPKSKSPVQFPGGMFDRDLDVIGRLIREGLTTFDIHLKTGATPKRIRRLRAVIKGTTGKEFRTKWLHRTDEEKKKSVKQVRRMIRQGYTDSQIFNGLNIPSVPFVIRQRKLMGNPKPTRKAWHTQHAAEIIACLRSGMSITQTGRLAQASRNSVRRIKACLEERGEVFACRCGLAPGHKTYCPFKYAKSKRFKLNPAKVRQLRKLYATGKWTHERLGKKFGLHPENASRIVRHLYWKHVL